MKNPPDAPGEAEHIFGYRSGGMTCNRCGQPQKEVLRTCYGPAWEKLPKRPQKSTSGKS